MSKNCECYKKLRLAVVVAAAVATMLVAAMEAAVYNAGGIYTMVAFSELYIISCIGSLG